MDIFAPAQDMNESVQSDSSEDRCDKLQICVMMIDKSIISGDPRGYISPGVGMLL